MATVKLNTKEFASMLSRASKCTIKGGIAMLAELVEIRLQDGTLSLRTTDTRNTMMIRKTGVDGDNFVATIPLDVFEKIVSKTSKEEIILEVDDRAVKLKGNGDYQFPLTIEGDAPVTFEPLKLLANPEVKKQFTTAEFVTAIKSNGSFVGSAFVDPSISGFYFGGDVVTFDMCACAFLHKKFFDEPVMLYPTTLALIESVPDEQIMFLKEGRKIQFASASCLIEAVIHTDTENFPIEQLNDLLKEDIGSGVTISKKAIVEILERVSLFVDMKTEFGATIFDFQEDGIHISDRKGKAAEVLPYKDPQNFVPFTCYVPSTDLIHVLDIDSDDDITLWFGNPTAVRIDVADATRVLALIPKEDLDGAIDFGTTEDVNVAEPEVVEDRGSVPVEFTATADPMADVQW